MSLIADLHIHSRYSRATSGQMTPEGLWQWAQIKGINVIGTGDFTHPIWLAELKEKLEPADEGLLRLKDSYPKGDVPDSCSADVLFMLQAEVSSIYKKNGRTRKVHSIILAPGFGAVEKINRRLAEIGNIKSDGRPILGLDAKDLLDIVLESSEDAMVIPAHAWTPHFSVFGSASGFDSLEECYEDLTPFIYAIETGLSSDPPMNRRLSALDGITLVSNSDAHSPMKLGREANLLDTQPTYQAITGAIKTGQGFIGTIEFFPEEGKYHLDGHRACGVRALPEETKKWNHLCPSCGRKLTVGVMHRVSELADREMPGETSYRSIIPLSEIIAECLGKGVNTKAVQGMYLNLLSSLGNEFHILLDAPLEDIRHAGGDRLAEGILKMREGRVLLEAGFDGEYGRIRVFEKNKGKKEDVPKRTKIRGDKKAGTRKKKQESLF